MRRHVGRLNRWSGSPISTLATAVALSAVAAAGVPAVAAPGKCGPKPATYGDSAARPGAEDPLEAQQWGLAQIKAPAAWARGIRGAGVKVAVIDSGIDLGHPDLMPNVKLAAFLGGDGCAQYGEAVHGTRTAGIIGAVGDNGIGISGVAPKASLLVYKDGETTPDLAITARSVRDAVVRGARVISLSTSVAGNSPENVALLRASLQFAVSRGVVVAISAGNDGTKTTCQPPSDEPGVICVASTDRRGNPVLMSSFPAKADFLAFRAPGGAAPSDLRTNPSPTAARGRC